MNRTEFAKILKAIVIPEGISNDELNKDAFQNDKIYAVTADMFNEPYDTLVQYDINSIRQFIDHYLNYDFLCKCNNILKKAMIFPTLIHYLI